MLAGEQMNWLAHVHLSEPSATFRLGNVLPDLVPARELTTLAAGYQRGIECHRRIDAFTDAHPCFRRSVARMPSEFRRYGGIIVDVLYDHFLSVSWNEHARQPLRRCVDEFYESFDPHRAALPSSVWPILERMREQDWLGSYGDLAGVHTALQRIGRRLRKPRDLGGCVEGLEAGYAGFQADFREFFPEITTFLAQNRRKIESKTDIDRTG
jgi:acyl carrier protein phosphodiesterase